MRLIFCKETKRRLQLLIDSGYYASACTHEPVLWLDLEAMSGTAENKKHETDELLSFNLRVACPASLNPLSSVLARKIKDSTASEVLRSIYAYLIEACVPRVWLWVLAGEEAVPGMGGF